MSFDTLVAKPFDATKGNFCGVVVRSKLLVEGYSRGHLVAKAHRATVNNDWQIGIFKNNRAWVVCGTVGKTLPEVLQRKVVLATLKELV